MVFVGRAVSVTRTVAVPEAVSLTVGDTVSVTTLAVGSADGEVGIAVDVSKGMLAATCVSSM
ncbi:MAG: hypothetical protein NVS4B8_04490 [Herpetosiphon sp.]